MVSGSRVVHDRGMDAPQLISRQQALAAGISDSELRRRCLDGSWWRVRAGRYVNAPEPGLTPAGRHLVLALATCEAMPEDAVASHCSAVVLHGVPCWSIPLDRVHLTRNRINGGRVTNQLVVHSAQLTPDEITIVNGLQVTTAPRTVVDIARSASFEQAVVIGDNALHQGLTTADELQECLSRARHRRGARRAAHTIDFLDGRSGSIGESRSRVAFREGGLPAPELQARVFTDDDVCVGRVGFLFPELGVIGEFGGKMPCQSALRTPGQGVIAEKNRADRLRALGWMVVRWTWQDLTDPAHLARRIRAAGRAAAYGRRAGHWTPTPRT